MGAWNEGDPLADLWRFVDWARGNAGFTSEVEEEAGYYCHLCQAEVTARVEIWTVMGWRRRQVICPSCGCGWPLIVKRREG